MTILANNKKALHNYTILEDYEAGIVLKGHEVKSVKNGQITLNGAYVSLYFNPKSRNNELFLKNCSISHYKKAGTEVKDNPLREKKLLLKKKEIASIKGKLGQKGLTLVPIKVYTKRSRIKLELAIVKGKKLFDKRESLKRKEIDVKIRRALRNKVL